MTKKRKCHGNVNGACCIYFIQTCTLVYQNCARASTFVASSVLTVWNVKETWMAQTIINNGKILFPPSVMTKKWMFHGILRYIVFNSFTHAFSYIIIAHDQAISLRTQCFKYQAKGNLPGIFWVTFLDKVKQNHRYYLKK